MRDVFIYCVLIVFLVAIPRRPYVGVLAWVIFSVMNPHRLTYGSAYSFPFAMIVAVVTIATLFLTKAKRELKGGLPGITLVLFYVLMGINTVFAFEPGPAFDYFEAVSKTLLMTAAMLAILHTRQHVRLLVWALVISLGFYGVKGGLFTMATGGNYLVNGPDGSVMEGNNALGVGLVVVIPLIILLYQSSTGFWLKMALGVSAGLCAVAVLGTYSRGAFLAIGGMAAVLWLRSSQKLIILLAVIGFAAIAVPAMPDRWTDRMNTIETYEEDSSASARLIAWRTAFNLAKDRFPIGGGFEYNSLRQSAKYSPDPGLAMVAHSIYFEVIGTQGFIGIGLFIFFWLAIWRQCAGIRKRCRSKADLRWEFNTASMIQVAIVGYLIGGAFLNLAFWDLPYYIFAISAVTSHIVKISLQRKLPELSSERDAALLPLRRRSLVFKNVGRMVFATPEPALIARIAVRLQATS